MKPVRYLFSLMTLSTSMNWALDLGAVEREIQRFESSRPQNEANYHYVVLIPPGTEVRTARTKPHRAQPARPSREDELRRLERLATLEEERLRNLLETERVLRRLEEKKSALSYQETQARLNARFHAEAGARTLVLPASGAEVPLKEIEDVLVTPEVVSPAEYMAAKEMKREGRARSYHRPRRGEDLPASEVWKYRAMPKNSLEIQVIEKNRGKQAEESAAEQKATVSVDSDQKMQEKQVEVIQKEIVVIAPPLMKDMTPDGLDTLGDCGRVFSPPALESVSAPYGVVEMDCNPCPGEIPPGVSFEAKDPTGKPVSIWEESILEK